MYKEATTRLTPHAAYPVIRQVSFVSFILIQLFITPVIKNLLKIRSSKKKT